MTPLLLTGLAVALAYRAGLLNIGCEGQLTIGALVSASFAVSAAHLPGFFTPPHNPRCRRRFGGPLGASGGVAQAAAWRARGDQRPLLNYMAIYLCSYMVSGPLGDGTAMGRTPPIPAGAQMPEILRSGSLFLTPAPL